MKYFKVLILLCALITISCAQVRHFWYSANDEAVMNKYNADRGHKNYKPTPMFIIANADTIKISQGSDTKDKHPFDTHPDYIGYGTVDYIEFTDIALYIHLKNFRRAIK